MQIYLSYRQSELGAAWADHFRGAADVVVTEEDIISLGADAIVSAANSFGFMDGGLDYQISERLGWRIQDRFQSMIRGRPLGELLIGEAIVVPTDDARTPWLISAPTMRVPMLIPESVNAYLAMKAILIAVQNHVDEVPIRSVAIPGLGTGIGRLDPRIAAAQMWFAYDEVVNRNRVFPPSFGDAQRMYRKLNPDARLSR